MKDNVGRVALGLAMAATMFSGSASARETGFLNRTVKVGGVEYRYVVYVPVEWNKKQRWPVILFLHGAGERGSDGLAQTEVGIGRAIRFHAERYPFVVVVPQVRADQTWTDHEMEAQALAALEKSIKEFKGDRERVYVTGISMGGYGTWNMGAKYPGKFAALAPVCGGIRGSKDWPQLQVEWADDPAISDPVAETARRIGKTPVWIFHGDDDKSVPVEGSRAMAEALRVAGGDVRYAEYPGVGHNSWDKAYGEAELPVWMLRQRTALSFKP